MSFLTKKIPIFFILTFIIIFLAERILFRQLLTRPVQLIGNKSLCLAMKKWKDETKQNFFIHETKFNCYVREILIHPNSYLGYDIILTNSGESLYLKNHTNGINYSIKFIQR